MVDFGEVFDNAFGTNLFPGGGEQPDLTKRTLKSTTSFARIVVFHYLTQNFGDAVSTKPLGQDSVGKLAVKKEIIEAEIVSIRTQKSISQPVGSFEASLMPTRNWKQVISPGDWFLVYLYSNESEFINSSDFVRQVNSSPPNKNLVFFGNVDRISRTKQKDEATDKTIVRYRMAGRDFGKVFQQTDIFFDPYRAEFQSSIINSVLTTKGLAFSGNPNGLVGAILDVFLNPFGGRVNSGNTPPLNQWEIPTTVSQVFQSGPSIGSSLLGDSFGYFNTVLKRKFAPSMPGFKSRSMIGPKSNGSLWDLLKRNCNNTVNEMFVDLVRDNNGNAQPTIVVRPRPNSVFFKDKDGGLGGVYESLQKRGKSSSYNISSIDIIFEDTGKDDEPRANMIWLEARQSAELNTTAYANVYAVGSPTGNGLPMVQQESVNRYGLKRFDAQLDFAYLNDKVRAAANISPILFRSMIAQLYDHKAYLHLYDTGTMETHGDLRAELGKVLRVITDDSSNATPTKIYYIEGYSHDWTFPGIWKTQYSLTMGQFDVEDKPFIDLSAHDSGTLDAIEGATTLSQTAIDRGVGIGKSSAESNDLISGLLKKF